MLVGTVDPQPNDIPVLTYSQFLDRLGGPVFSLLPFDIEYTDRLATLGQNKLPIGLAGTASDLFEQYVHAGLQFLFRTRVIRYGQERRGEPVPDGIALGRSIPLILYDAKAADGGYDTSYIAVRQFSDYIEEFHKRYETQVGRVGVFLVISGTFADSRDVLVNRSREVRAKCGVSLSFLTADVLSAIVKLLVKEPLFRSAIDWSYIFSETIINVKDVEKSLRQRLKDRVLST